MKDGKAKRLICAFMAALALVLAPLATYMEASAVEILVPTTVEIIEAVLASFGLSVGLGNQGDYFKQSSFADLTSAISNGHTYHMDNYGDVDFADDESMMNWLKWSKGFNDYLKTPGYAPINKYGNAMMAAGMMLDHVSYKMTGTSATTAMNNYIDDLISYFDVSGGGTVSLDMRDSFGFFSGAGGSDDEDPDKIAKRFKCIMAAISAAIIGGVAPLEALKLTDNSEFTEHDAAFSEDVFFDGNYTRDADGQYVVKLYDSKGIWHNNVLKPYIIDTLYSDKLAAYRDGDYISFCTSSSFLVYLPVKDLGLSMHFMSSAGFHGNLPLYPSLKAAQDALKSGDFSGAENIVENPYKSFKENTASASPRLDRYLKDFFASAKSLRELPAKINPVLEVSDTNAGKQDILDAVEDALVEASPDIPAEPDPADPSVPVDPPVPGTDYSGILGRILAAINSLVSGVNSLSSKMVNAFAGKFMTADVLKNTLDAMPKLFAQAFADALVIPLAPVIAAINAVSDAVIDTLPDAIADALDDVVITVPDIVIPEIVVPDIVVPEIKIPEITVPDIVIPEIAAPDVSVTLDPSYNITVENDFTGLEGIIISAVEWVLTECFVPDEAAAMAKFGDMQAYFRFKDDISMFIGDLKTMIFGITPSPILKIPIGKPESRYNYGLGGYIIIDISWYARYKQLGDKIILALVWAFFLWRMYIKLPGIISGAEGGIVAADRAHTRYELTKSSRRGGDSL